MALPIEILPRVMQVIGLMQDGRLLSDACDRAGVSYTTVRRYIEAHPELQSQYDNAVRFAEDMMAEALVTIGSHPVYGTNVPAMASVISSNIKWVLSRRRPKEYGDKIEHSVHITADKEVIEALMRAKERSQGFIEATVVAPTSRALATITHSGDITDIEADDDDPSSLY